MNLDWEYLLHGSDYPLDLTSAAFRLKTAFVEGEGAVLDAAEVKAVIQSLYLATKVHDGA